MSSTAPPPGRPGPARTVWLWRVLAPLAFAVAGLMFVASADSARGTDLRPASSIGLAGLVQHERGNLDALLGAVARLERQVDALSARVDDPTLGRLTRRIRRLQEPAGLTPLTGDGVEVVLDDAPRGQPVPEGLDPNVFVVHQQDLQAVVNALWSGGARGITLQGQRIVSTTGIKCVGNTVLLHGVPYSPPYRIVAIGDPASLRAGLARSETVQTYLDYTRPPVNLGWELTPVVDHTIPAYDGPVSIEYADPAPGSIGAKA